METREVNLDDVIDMLAFMRAKNDPGEETIKDAISLLLSENSSLELESLYRQVVERSEVLEGVV